MSEHTETRPETENAPVSSVSDEQKDTGKDRGAKSTKARKRKRILRRAVITLLVLVLLGGAGLYTWARLKDEYTVTYDEYNATTGTISNALSFSGALALRSSASYSAEADATVRTIYVAAGDSVKKGDRLIRLSNGESYTADFDGRVNVVNYAVGDEVSKGSTLVQIADFGHMQVSFRIDEYDISEVGVGDRCTVTATATEKTFESRVETINYISSSSGNVAYYTAMAYVDVDEGVYPGMQVTVTIPQEEASDVVVLKLDALSFTEANQAFVYTMGEDGAMKETEVEVGVSNGNYVEIKSGLKSGDVVYAEAKTETTSTITSLFSGLFGGQRVNNGGGNRNSQRNSNSSGYDSGTRSTDGSGGSSNRPSGGGTGGGR